MIYRVSHLTEYLYGEPVSSAQHQLHLLPRASVHQETQWEELTIDPPPARRQDRTDYFGNRATNVEIQEPHRRLAVLVRSEIDLHPAPPPPATSPSWESVRDGVRRSLVPDDLYACELSFGSPFVPSHSVAGIGAFVAPSFTPGRPLVEAAVDLMHRIHATFIYDAEATNISTPVAEVLAEKRGVCQDFAHLALACFRSLGLPCRYVSGYLVTTIPGQPRLIGADASHAWVGIYCPGVGWLDLDPTNDVLPSDKHITVAYGRDFGDVTPLRGVILGGGHHELRVVVDVVPMASEA